MLKANGTGVKAIVPGNCIYLTTYLSSFPFSRESRVPGAAFTLPHECQCAQ